jgi:hypothetical protein
MDTTPLILVSYDCEHGVSRRVTITNAFWGGSFAVFASILVSLPSLLGRSCFADIFEAQTTAAGRRFSHEVCFAINLAILTNLVQSVIWRCSARPVPDHFGKYGPAYLMAVAADLLMTDLVRHLFRDAGMPSFDMYHEGCDVPSFACLSVAGWVFTVGCTYCGLICMMASVLWVTDAHAKLTRGAFARRLA